MMKSPKGFDWIGPSFSIDHTSTLVNTLKKMSTLGYVLLEADHNNRYLLFCSCSLLYYRYIRNVLRTFRKRYTLWIGELLYQTYFLPNLLHAILTI